MFSDAKNSPTTIPILNKELIVSIIIRLRGFEIRQPFGADLLCKIIPKSANRMNTALNTRCSFQPNFSSMPPQEHGIKELKFKMIKM